MADVQPEPGDQEAHDRVGFLQAVLDAVGCGVGVGKLEQHEQDQAEAGDGHACRPLPSSSAHFPCSML